ncbi:MAG: acetate--CoA ligase family protein [Candidatus Hodarchaeales archaeon]
MAHLLDDFFSADSVVVIGASKRPDAPGHIIAKNFVESSFEGDCFFVNPRLKRLFTKIVYPSVSDLPETPDLGIIVAPARLVPNIAAECGQKGIKRLVIRSGGFSEIGPEGKILEQQLLDVTHRYGIRFIGPNCLGIYVPDKAIDTIFLPRFKVQRPTHGPMAFFTQSGAFGAAFLSEIYHLGYGRWVSKFVAFGNAIDIHEGHVLEFLGDDDETKVILGYLEGFRNAARFLTAAEKISLKKPIILIKGNRTPAGARAATSHTASVASNDLITSNLLSAAGIVRVNDWEEMINASKVFATQPLPNGNKIAVITNGGGVGVMTSDAISMEGMDLADFSSETLTQLNSLLPPLYVKTNPVDLTGSSTNEQFFLTLEQVAADPNVDSVIFVVLTAPPYIDPMKLVSQMRDYLSDPKKSDWIKEKPFIALTMGGEEAEVLRSQFERLGVPTYSQPRTCVRSLAKITQYSNYLKIKTHPKKSA